MRLGRIVGTGAYVPARHVDNREVCRPLSLSPEGVYRRTGIRTRRWANPDQAASDLAERAARQALETGDLAASSVDTIILSTTSPDMPLPATACLVAAKLGLRGAAAFDVAASCSGFLYALSMADRLLRTGQSRCCMVIAAEVKSRCLDLRDPTTAVLFADGAGAAMVVAEEVVGPEPRGILGIRLYADGARHDLISMEAGGSRVPLSGESVREGRHTLRLKGGPLFRVAVRHLARAVTDLLKEFGVNGSDLRWAVFHQANGRLLDALADRLSLPPRAIVSVIEELGNASSASLPIALDRAVRQDRVAVGELGLLGAFGGGLTWGTALVRW